MERNSFAGTDGWIIGGGPKGMLAPPLKLLGGGPGPPSSYAYVIHCIEISVST